MDGGRNVELRASEGAGTVGLGRLVYGPSHENYQMVLEHVGRLEPGEQKLVLPFPEQR